MADRLPAVASGARTTVAGIVSTRLKVDMSETIFDFENQGAPLYTTLAMIAQEDAIAKTVSWHVDELVPKFIRINGGTLDDSGLTFTVDTPGGTYVPPGYLLQNTRTGETYISTTGGTATTFVVTARSWGATAAAATVDNDEILIIGPAYAENATLQAAVTTTEEQFSNYLQTFRHNWSMGGLLKELAARGGTYGGDDAKRQREKMLATHKRSLELSVLFGEGAASGGTATSHGFIPWVAQNATGNVNTATVLTEPVFEAGNATWFRGGQSDQRTLVAARPAHGIINQFPGSVQRTTPGATKYGLRITNYMSAHGDIAIIRNTAMEGDKYSTYMFGFDPSQTKLKMGRNTRMLKDRQGTSVDGYEEEILTDMSVVLGLPEACYLWTSIAA